MLLCIYFMIHDTITKCLKKKRCFFKCTSVVSMPRSLCAMPSHPHRLVTASRFMCMWLPRRPSTVSSLQSLSHSLMYPPHPSLSFAKLYDGN